MQAIERARATDAIASLAVTAAKVIGPAELSNLVGLFDDSILDITSTLTNSGYSQEFEFAADKAAITILKRVGYNPNVLIEMLEAMSERLEPGGLDFAKTHPDPQVRIGQIKTYIGDGGFSAKETPAMKKRYAEAMRGL